MPRTQIAPIHRQELQYFIAESVDHLCSPEMKKTIDIKKVIEDFEVTLAKMDEVEAKREVNQHGYVSNDNFNPLFFGTDTFPGLKQILKQMNFSQCPKHEMELFRGKV